MKKRTRMIIVLASVLALVLIIVLWFLLGGGKWNKGPKDTPYPYSYQLQRDGSVRISIKEDTTGGFSWKFEEEQMNDLKHSELKVSNDKMEFTITPLRVGLVGFTLQHRRESAMVDCDYAYDFIINVTEDLKVDLVSAQGKVMEPMREKSSPSGFKFSASFPQPTELSFQFSAPENQLYNWQLEMYDEALMAITIREPKEGGFNLHINSLKKGTSDLRVVARPPLEEGQIVSDRPGVIYTCRLTIGEQNEIAISDETFEEFTGVQLSGSQLTQLTEARQWIDRPLVVPEGAVITQFYYTETLTKTPVAEMKFMMEKGVWRLTATKKEYANKLLEDILSGREKDAHQENVKLKEGTMKLILIENEYYGFWQDAGGVAWRLSEGYGSTMDIKTMAEALWQVNK